MNKFIKSVLALGISSALSLSIAHAAKYEVIDKGGIDIVKFSYAQQENNQSQMAVSGTDIYNFPVQFQYLSECVISSSKANGKRKSTSFK